MDITPEENAQQAKEFTEWQHRTTTRQVDSVDPKQKGNKMIKIDSKIAEIRDRSMSDEDWVKEMMKFGG